MSYVYIGFGVHADRGVWFFFIQYELGGAHRTYFIVYFIISKYVKESA